MPEPLLLAYAVSTRQNSRALEHYTLQLVIVLFVYCHTNIIELESNNFNADSYRHSQPFCQFVRTGIPVMNHYKAWIYVSGSMT